MIIRFQLSWILSHFTLLISIGLPFYLPGVLSKGVALWLDRCWLPILEETLWPSSDTVRSPRVLALFGETLSFGYKDRRPDGWHLDGRPGLRRGSGPRLKRDTTRTFVRVNGSQNIPGVWGSSGTIVRVDTPWGNICFHWVLGRSLGELVTGSSSG